MTSMGPGAAVALLAEGRVLEALALQPEVEGAPDAAPRWLAEAMLAGLAGSVDSAWAQMMRCVAWGAVPPSTAIGFASALGRPALAEPLLEDLCTRGARADDPTSELALIRAEWMLGRDSARGRARRLEGASIPLPQLLRAADLLEILGLYEVLEAALEEADVATSEDGLARLAQLALWRGDHARAERRAVELEALAPDRGDAGRVRGAAAVLDGRPEDALEHLARSLSLTPRDQETLLWTAEAQLALGALGDAWRTLERAAREFTEAFAVGVLRAHVETIMLLCAHPDLPAGLEEVLTDRDALEQRYGLVLDGGLPPWCGPDVDLVDVRTRRDVTGRILAGLAGNRSARPTWREGDRLHRYEPTRSVRMRSDWALRVIQKDTVDRAYAELDALADTHRASPHPLCFRGELHLFRGALDAATADFEGALTRRPTRWAYVGIGAVRMLRGDLDGAERAFARTAAFGPAPGATTHVYRGEGLRRAGRHEEARVELEIAVSGRPSRIAAWINLALLGPPDAEPAMEELRARAPALLFLASRDVSAPDSDPRVLERCLERLGGNRSSRVVTIVDDAGALRVLPPPGPLVAFGREGRALRASSADSATTIEVANALALLLARAPTLPAPLPMLGLRLLSVQRADAAVDLVIGRAAPLGLLRVRGPGRAEALVPASLEVPIGRALAQLAARIAKATTPARWREANRRLAELPTHEAPI